MSDLADHLPELTPERRQRILDRGRARVRRNRRIVGATVAVLVLVAVALPVVLSSGHDHQGLDVAGRPHPTAATPSTEVATTSTSTAVAAPTTPAPTTSSSATAPRSLVADGSVKAALREAFLTAKGLQPDEIASAPTAGSVYYAYAPATQTYWGMAEFTPTASMTFQHSVNMQDGGDEGIFARSSGGSWRMLSIAQIPWPCPGWFPPDIERVWALAMAPGCDSPEVPVGGPLDLVLGADYYLYPAGWTVTPLTNFGGPASFASAIDPASGARIDYEINAGSLGGLYNADGTPNVDDPNGGARTAARCPVTQSAKIDSATVSFTCAPTASGLPVEGIVYLGPIGSGVITLTITLPSRDQAVAATMIAWFEGSVAGHGE
jgi:hypothetical protein